MTGSDLVMYEEEFRLIDEELDQLFEQCYGRFYSSALVPRTRDGNGL